MKKYISEFIGTFGLVFCGTGAIVINDVTGGEVTNVGIGLTFGLIVMAMIYSFGAISGAHINPAVTVSFWLSGKFPGGLVLPYMVAQCSGALIASIVLLGLFPSHMHLGATLPSGSIWQTFVLEIILSFFLMLVILQVSTGAKEVGMMAGFAIGSVVLLEAIFAGPITGASMNPARSLAPALISGTTQHLWVYLVAPTIGMCLSVPIWRILHSQEFPEATDI